MEKRIVFVNLVLLAAVLFWACNKPSENTTMSSPPAESSAAATPRGSPTFAQNLQFVRNGRYKFVWVFSRKDGKAIDKEDAAYLRTNAPQVVDWVMSDEGKRAIGGTNFDLEQGNLEQLKKRFVVEDYSRK